jgi:hypothetical protein
VNPSMVRRLLRIIIHLAEHLIYIELDIILSGADSHAGRQTESATLLTITVSAHASSSPTATVTTVNTATGDRDNPARDNQTDQTEMLSAALGRAEDAINTMETWNSAVDVIKRVMDAVSPIAAVCPYIMYLVIRKLNLAPQLQPYASLAWSLLSKIPEVRLVALSGDTEGSPYSHLDDRPCYSR